jgi:putative tricarboxylic transport membrane protein
MQSRGSGPAGPAWGDTAAGAAVLGLAGIVGWQTTLVPQNAVYAQVGPAAIPWLTTAMLAVLGAALVWRGLRGGWERETHGAFDAWGLGWLLAGLALNVALIGTAGFILASTVLFACTARAFGSRSILRDAGIGFVLAFIAYAGFDRLLGYRIGSGLIEGLF